MYRAAQSSKEDESAQKKMSSMQVDMEYLDRIHDLERQIKQLNAEKEADQETTQRRMADQEELTASYQS